MNDNYISLKKLSKVYTDKVGYRINLLQDISLEIDKKEFISILAPAGSGKTSLLKLLAGLIEPTSGSIESNIKRKPFIPSLPSSFPWLSVKENVSFYSELNETRIDEIIDLVGLHGYENHFPHDRSEGFRFRISLGRALAINPGIIIIDEPFNNLNTDTRKEIYSLVRSVFEEKSIPFIFGTTNITEAIYLSDKIHLMKKNPGQIFDSLPNNIVGNRNLDIIESKDFFDMRERIENRFKDRADRTLYNFSI